MNNPFTISFGMLPQKLISRPAQTNEIIDAFTSDQAPTHTFMITGVRAMFSETEKTGQSWN